MHMQRTRRFRFCSISQVMDAAPLMCGVRRLKTNPFMNHKTTRFVSFREACQDLADALRSNEATSDSAKMFILLLFGHARSRHTSQVVIGAAPAFIITETTPDNHRHVSTYPPELRAPVISELIRMAGMTEGAFPKEGSVFVQRQSEQYRWKIRLAGPDHECVLTPLED
jgi:hypothetical protein